MGQGFLNAEEYVRELVRREVYGAPGVDVDAIMDKLKSKIKRMVEDIVNEYMKTVFENKQKIAELSERIEELSSRIEEIGQKPQPGQPPQPRMREVQQSRRRRKRGIEILHEQKILYESRLERLRDKDRFFEYLKREGAVVLELEGERVAVDPEFWNSFIDKLSRINTPDEAEASRYLSALEKDLFNRLRRSRLVIFDHKTRTWRLVAEEY